MKSGSPIVDEIYQINFEGNITPHSWYQHSLLRTEGGKPNLVAITLLADLVYWYRPVIIKDEATNRIIALRRKFRYHRVFKDYQQWGNYFGFTKRQVQDAVAFLKRRGLIIVEIRPFTFDTGVTVGTVVFLEPILNALKAVTFDVTQVTFNSDPPLSGGDPTFESDQPLVETESPSRFNENGVTFNSDHSTESSPKESSKNQQQQAIAVVVSDSSESASASTPQSNGTEPGHRVLKLPQSDAAPPKLSTSQKRVRREAAKQFDVGQTALPQVAAVGLADRRHAAAPVVEKLLAIGTGADPRMVMRYASLNPQHAEKVATYFPDTRENTQNYWDEYNERTGKDHTRASGLMARLQNPHWEPPQLAAERKREENALAVRARREREQSERLMAERMQQEENARVLRESQAVVEEYRGLDQAARLAVRDLAWNDELLRGRTNEAVKNGTVATPKADAPASAALDGWTREHTGYTLLSQALRKAMDKYSMEHQAATGEDEDFDEVYDVPSISEEEFIERQIEHLAAEIEGERTTLENLDARRVAYALDGADCDAMWAQIHRGVERRVLDQAA